jgi:TRAP-type C4-dicarboxylate transport system permease large subunit
MNWKTVLSLSLFGVLMGILSLLGYARGIEWFLWGAIAVISAIVINKSSGKIFPNGIMAGLLMGVFSTIITLVFLDKYVQNNPGALDETQGVSFLAIEAFLFFMGLFIGFVYGLFIALLSWVFSKFMRKSA